MKTGISVQELLKLLDKDQFDAKFLIFNSFKSVGMGLVQLCHFLLLTIAQI